MSDQQKTLYVVHSGEYSDYKFHGIFSSREEIAEMGVDELAALTKEQSVVEIDHETGKDS